MTDTATMSTPRALSPIESFRKEATAMEKEMSRALPPHIPLERFMRVIQTAVQTSMASNFTNLLECDRRSLWQAAMRAAQDGLLPDGREGAILKYGNDAQWIPMVAGIRKKARNSGEISTWDVHCVYQNDNFVLKLGDAPSIEHTYDLAKDRGLLIGAYSVALLKDGSKSYEVMSINEIHAIRDRSQAWKAYKGGKIKSTPWSTDEAEMARKTVAKRHAKQLPSSADLDDLIRRDDEFYEYKQDAEDSTGNVTQIKPPKGKGTLDQFAAQIEHSPKPEDSKVEDLSPADAYALGAEAYEAKGERKVPREISAAGEAFSSAWLSGFDSAGPESAA